MRINPLRRREFITLVGSAAAWPLVARAQGERVRRIGVITNIAKDDPESQSRNAAFEQALEQVGRTNGRNVHIDYRWTLGDPELTRKQAAELIALPTEVILAVGAEVMSALRQATHTVPIVFVLVPDPVGAGFVESLAHPGGNATGFTTFEYGVSGKWLELLKEIAPGVKQAAIIRDDTSPNGPAQFAAIQAVAPSLRMEVNPIGVRQPGDIEGAITAFARTSNRGLIVTGSALAAVHHNLIITLAARHQLPAVYFARFFVAAGGLVSYGPNLVDQFRLAAGYVDRILKGEKPADLPVQAPTKYELVLNLKTAKALGLEIPPTVLARADEVIE
jgi:putative ABC transport system substrate-binding protein